MDLEPGMTQFHSYGDGSVMFKWLDGSLKAPREVIFEGIAGGGKTRIWGEWIKAACNQFPESKGLVMRKTRVSLNDSFLAIWEDEVLGKDHPCVMGGATKEHRIEYRHPQLGGVVVLGGMDNPKKLFSTQYDWIYVNECQELTKNEWESLHRALRRTKMPFRILGGDCNPEDEFHWANQRMNDGKCVRLISRFWDNPTFYDHQAQDWTELGRDYLGRLRENLSGPLLRRLYHGEWVSAHGQVWGEYDPRVHLLDGSVREEKGRYFLDVDKWKEPVELVYFCGSQDIGFVDPGVAQVWGLDAEGRMYRVAEIYQTGKDHDWWGQRWVEFYEEFPVRSIICDHDKAFIASLNRRIRGRGEDGQQGIARPAQKRRGRGEEMVGIDDVRVRLKARADGTRGIYFLKGALRMGRDPVRVEAALPCCTEQEIPSYVYLETEEGKPNKDMPDPKCEEHGCFIAGTMVRTPLGPMPIESLWPGDQVETHAGAGNVTASGLMDPDAQTYRLDFEGGSLVGTGNHPIWTQRGWVPLEHLTPLDMLCGWSNENQSSTQVGTGTATPVASTNHADATSRAIAPTCTTKSGPTLTAQSLTGCWFTTETATSGTTTSATWCFSLPPNTRESIGPKSGPMQPPSDSTESVTSPRHGTDLPRGERGTASTVGSVPQSVSLGGQHAISADLDTSRRIPCASARTIASQHGVEHLASTTLTAPARSAVSHGASTSTSQSGLAPRRVLRVCAAGRAPVYNLTVEGQHTYVAGGVLVSNCDTTRYVTVFIKDRSWKPSDENRPFKRDSLNDRLGYNKPAFRHFFRNREGIRA